MTFSAFIVQLLNGLAGASSLFLVAAGLSLIFGVTRIVNFAHGSFYMLGIYGAYSLAGMMGGGAWFWPALLVSALAVGAFIGKTKNDNGKGTMVDYRYLDGAKYLPSGDEVRKMRAQD